MVSILLIGTTLTICTLCVFLLLSARSDFYLVCRIFLVFILIHFLHVLICEVFFGATEDRFLDWAAPYGLLYGPFLVAAQRASIGKLNKRKILLHALPFVVLLVSYLLILFFEGYREGWLQMHRIVLYRGLNVSFLVYALLVIFQRTKVKRLLSLFAIILCTTSLLFISVRLSMPESSFNRFQWPRSVAYFMMTGVVAVLFRYALVLLAERMGMKKRRVARLQVAETVEVSYQKSVLPADVMEKYHERLKNTMLEEKVFLDQDLSLERLASKLKMPRHHLTQLLSVHLNSNFYQYVNAYRVDYACELIKKDNAGTPLEEIGLMSGFNSKTSFNRYFRNQTNLTPSEYRKKYREE